MEISHEEIKNAYRYLLGRYPESESAYATYHSVQSIDRLHRIIIDSAEYQSKKDRLKRFFIIGNCQTEVIANLIETMVPSSTAAAWLLTPKHLQEIDNPNALKYHFAEADLVFIQLPPGDPILDKINSLYEAYNSKIRLIPNINYTLYHPDMIYVQSDAGTIKGPMGEYHSALAFFAWKQGLSLRETKSLFNREIFAHVGYFEHAMPSAKMLIETGAAVSLPLDALLERWGKLGCFMHTMNHPKLSVLADVTRAALIREGITYIPGIDQYVDDPLALHPCWPVYPEIAETLGIEGSYYFKRSTNRSLDKLQMIDLEDFIIGSFETYDKYEKNELRSSALETSFFKSLPDFLKAYHPNKNKGFVTHPYSNLKNAQYWRRSMEKTSIADVDPVVTSRFKIKKTCKVATAGSCFAQHISRTLSANGFNYYIPENGSHLPAEDAIRKNFGVFSARYANIYTSSQLLQLFEEAFGIFTPIESFWKRSDGKYVDPYRPQIEPDGFNSVPDLSQARHEHLGHVRKMFEELDIFVFTLGLTETWRTRADRAVFPIAPGVAGGIYDANKYEFVNLETADVIEDLEKFINHLAAVNPNAKIIFTVSPVPLVATYEERHVLTSTTYSKSALRSAADAIVRRYSHCDYFPSYEIITGSYSRAQFYEDDLRSVTEAGVAKVMGLFMKHYADSNSNNASELTETRSGELYKQFVAQSSIICEEELLDTTKPAQ